MQVKTLVSAIALTAAITFSGSAFAQDEQIMIGDSPVSAEDLPAVEERCAALVEASTNESLTEEDTDGQESGDDSLTEEDGDSSSESGEESGDSEKPSNNANGEASATTETAEDVNEVLNATTTLDLDTVTLEWCEENDLGGSM
jgi:hypothetical protein